MKIFNISVNIRSTILKGEMEERGSIEFKFPKHKQESEVNIFTLSAGQTIQAISERIFWQNLWKTDSKLRPIEVNINNSIKTLKSRVLVPVYRLVHRSESIIFIKHFQKP